MNYLIRKCLFTALCLCFCMSAGQLYGQVTYTVTGIVDTIGGGIFSPSEVADGETFDAVFQIDLSVEDIDPSSERGEFPGAILSSSIEFSGGYSSQVDFAGGDIVIQRDAEGGGVFFNDLDIQSQSNFLVFDLGNAFDSDALPVDAASNFVGSPESLFSLVEPFGRFSVLADVEVGPNSAPFAFSITAGPEIEPVVLGDLDGNRIVNFLDISGFIMRLTTGTFQAEADIDQNGEVNFLDISPFIRILIGGDDVDE